VACRSSLSGEHENGHYLVEVVAVLRPVGARGGPGAQPDVSGVSGCSRVMLPTVVCETPSTFAIRYLVTR